MHVKKAASNSKQQAKPRSAAAISPIELDVALFENLTKEEAHAHLLRYFHDLAVRLSNLSADDRAKAFHLFQLVDNICSTGDSKTMALVLQKLHQQSQSDQ